MATTRQVNMQIAGLGSSVAALKQKTSTLVRIDARAAARIKKLEGDVERLTGRVEAFGEDAGQGQLAAFGKEAKRLEGVINSAFADLQGQIDEHDNILRIHGEGIAQLHDQVDGMPEAKYDLEKSRVDVAMTALTSKAHWVAAFIVGVVVFLATWLSIYGSISSGSWSHGNDVWIGLIVGVAAGLVVASFETFTAKVAAQLLLAHRESKPEAEPMKTKTVPVVDKKEVNA